MGYKFIKSVSLPTVAFAALALAGCGGSSNTTQTVASSTPAPASLAPTNLGAAPGNNNVSLSWTASVNSVNYKIYRGTTPGAQNGTLIATITTTNFTDTTAVNGQTYYYYVVATDAAGHTSSSAEVMAHLVTPVPISSILRTFAAGDAWHYNVTGVIDLLAGGQKQVNVGSYVVGVQDFPQGTQQTSARWYYPPGQVSPPTAGATPSVPGWDIANFAQPNMTFSYAYNLLWNDSSTEVRNYLFQFAQEANGNVFKYGDTLDNGTFATAGNFENCDDMIPQYQDVLINGAVNTRIIGYFEAENAYIAYLPGNWNTTPGLAGDNSLSVAIANSDGSMSRKTTNHEHFALTVLGQSVVSVPLGTFTCWKCNMISGYQGQDRTINTTGYWAPQLGAFVSMDTVEDVTNVGQERLHFELISTTVPPYNTIGAAVKRG